MPQVNPAQVKGATLLMQKNTSNFEPGFGENGLFGLFPEKRTKSGRQIIEVNGKMAFQDAADFRPNPTLQELRLPSDRVNYNGKYFSLPIATGVMNFVRTGPKPTSPSDVTILVLPGCPDQNYTQYPMVNLLAQKHDVVALEVPGRGWATDRNKSKHPFTMDSSAYAIKAAIKQLGLKNVVIVSHSFGQSEAMHALATQGAKELGVVGMVSLNGWNPQLTPDALPYDFMETLAVNRLTAGIAWKVAKSMPKAVAGETWKKMVNEKDKSETLDRNTTEWSKVFEGRTGYTEVEAYNTVRQENQTGKRIEQYQKNLQPYITNLTSTPVLFIGAKADKVVRGAKDPSGEQYAQRNFEAIRKLGNTNALTQVITPDGDHCFQFAHPDVAAAPILDWVSKLQKAAQEAANAK